MKISKLVLLVLSFFVLCSNFSPSENLQLENKAGRAYTTNQDLKTISIVDLETGVSNQTIQLEFSPKGIVVSEATERAYVLQQDSNLIIPIDLQTGETLETIVLQENPKQLLISNDGQTAYIMSEDSSELLILDLKTKIPYSLTSLNNIPSNITLSNDGKILYASYYGSNEISSIDLESVKAKSSIYINEEPIAIAMTADGQMASVGYRTLNQLNFFDVETGDLDSSLTVDDDSSDQTKNIETIHMSQDGQKAYLTHENSTFITEVNLKEKKADKFITTDHSIQGFALFEKKKSDNPLSELNPFLAPTEATSTVLVTSPNPSAFGQSVTFTATVTSATPGTLTGNVTFYDGATSLGTGTLSLGVATFSTSSLILGSHTITAEYEGDATFLPSTSTATTLVVNQATTSTSVASSLNPSITGQNVTFTATVTLTSGAGTPTGTITFKDGATTIGTGSVSAGVATFATSSLTVASHSITAVYGGDLNFSGSTSPTLTQTVNQGTTTTTVTSSANPSIFGNSITLTATLNITAGIGTATGTVTFKDGATTIGTGSVSAGIATFATSTLAIGSHSITAVYGGDVNFSGSTSPTLIQVINQGSTSTVVTSSLNPSTYGASVTFTSTTSVTTGAGTPTGTVTFFDGATSLGSSSINGSGVATFSTINLTVGSHSITTVYNGDTNFSTSTSPILTQVVNQATPLVTITSSLNPSLFGDLVTFTGTVNSPTTLGLPAGTVSFFDGATLLGTGTLIPTGANTSKTTFAISTLTAGSHSVTAVYSGDSNFISETSITLNQIVNQAMTTVTSVFSNSPNPTQYGQPVVLQATVTGSVGNPPFPPTGTVIFYDGATVLGSATLSSISPSISTASLTVTTLSIGSHNITASYQGDTNYPASTSAIFTQNVIKTGTTSVVASSSNPSVYGQTVIFSSDVNGNTPGMGNATGTVLFYDGVNLLGTGTLSPTGPNTSTATFSTSGLTLGTHRIISIYLGDVNFTSSTSPALIQVVAKDPTTTTLTSSLNPSNFGDSITLTATAIANAPGSGTPTGSVQFYDGATLLATRNLSGGVATYSTIALYPGTHSLTAVYSGDTNFISSTSSLLSQVVVNQLPTVTTITSSRNSSPTGDAVTYSARVTAITGTPTGTVTFYDLTNSPLPIGTGTIVGGVATITEPGTSLIALGLHQIEAVYNGDANFITSTSAIYNQYVVPFDTTTTLVTNPNPSTQSNATFTATVAIIGSPGPLTGNVKFYEDGVLISGTVNFNQVTGVATLMPNNLHFGSHAITAVYSGDTTSFATSTSNTVIQQVQQTDMLTTNIVLTSSLSTADYCQLVTLTATVTQTQGFYIPTGYVTFFSNEIAIGGALLNEFGVAKLNLTTLPIGSLTLSAAYNTDSNYAYSESNNVNVNIDANNTTTVLNVIPNLSSTPYTQNLFFSAQVNADYGIATGSVTFFDGIENLATVDLDATGQAFYETATLAAGSHTITAIYNPDSCFMTSTGSLIHTITKTSPIMSYSGNPNPSIYGEPILLTATLSSALGEYPTGTITFYNGTTALGTAELVNGKAYFILNDVAAGVAIIKGTYSGDSNFLATNLPSFVQKINKASSSTCLDGYSSNPTQYGQIITFNATVSSEAETPTGNVVFKDGSTVIGTIPLTGCGTAILDTSNLNLGSNIITATYSGDSNFNASTSTIIDQNVIKADSETIVVSSTPNPSVYNGLVTFNISVGNIGTGNQVPTGTVTGYFGSTVLGIGTLTNGLASFSTTALPAGVDTVIIKYPGDTNFNPSSVATTQTVTTLATTATLTSSNNPSVFGQTVTFSVNVTSTSGTATGTVSFLDGTTTLATETLNTSGQASLTLSNLSTGTHSIRAIYSGSANLSGATSNTISQVVNKASTTTTLSSTNNPSIYGENVTFNAFVTASGSGTGIPTGTVTFKNGAATIGTGSVNAAGMATFTTSSLNVSGSPYSITAVYGGNVNFLTSTSSILSETINKSATITSATATPNPANLGNSVTLNVSVLPINTGSGTPTGTVTAYYGSQVVGTATLNGSGQATFSTSSLPAGTLGIVVQYGGDSSYLGSSTTITEKITQNSSTTTLTSSANPSSVGQNITLTAAVTSTSGTPTGIVAFFDGSTPIGTVTLNGSAQATLTSSSLTLGTHSITAVYTGDVNNLGSTSTVLNQVINQASTTTTVTSGMNPSDFGNPLVLTALVNPSNLSSVIPTGTVTFKNGATTIGTVNINSNREALLTITSLPVGNNSITAVYNGDLNFVTSTSSTLTQQVDKTDTLIKATSTPNPSAVGNNVTFNVTVSPINTTGVFPSGTVNAYYGSTLLGTTTLNGSGQATFVTSLLPAGTLGIMINYLGDLSFNASTMTITQTVNQVTSTTVLTSSLNPSLVGESVTFTATVTSSLATPTGSATFYDGSSIIGVQALNGSGIATLTLSSLQLGTHPISVVYTGSASISSSTSNTLNQVVNQSSTTTTLVSSLNPSNYSNSVTFTAQVLATAPGGGIPTGTVTFKDGATILGTSNINTVGAATFSISSLATGTHSITAVYNGDTNFITSTSSAVSQVVNTANTATTILSSTPNPSMFGEVVTFFATVTSSQGVPTGTISFFDGVTLLGTVPSSDGLGIFATPTLSLGTHSITAVYNGDSNFNSSTSSPPYVQVVNQTTITITTVTTLTSNLNPSTYGDLVTFNVTVSPIAGPGLPTGVVTIYHGSDPLTTLTLVAGSASYSTFTLPAGNLNIVALYSGDSQFSSSTNTIIQVVNPITTTTTISSSSNPSYFTDPVIFTANITASNSVIPTGSVTFYDGAAIVGSVILDNMGDASLTLSNLTTGSHNITAVYQPDPNFITSSDALTQVVDPAITSTFILTANPNPSKLGETVTFLATTVSGGSNISGTLTFYDGATVIGTAPLFNSLAIFSTSSLSVGTHSITASFTGNSNFATSTSLPYTQIVNPTTFSTTTTLASSINPSQFGQSVIFTASVTSGSGIPTGTVSFFDGVTSIGTIVLNSSATASLTTSTLTIGSHSITAVYSGDANYGNSTSSILTQVVGASSIPNSPENFRGCQLPNKFLNESSYKIRLTWDAPSSGATPTSYRIYSNEGLTKLVAEVASSQHLYEIFNVKKNKKHQYYIVSVNGSDVSTAATTTVYPKNQPCRENCEED